MKLGTNSYLTAKQPAEQRQAILPGPVAHWADKGGSRFARLRPSKVFGCQKSRHGSADAATGCRMRSGARVKLDGMPSARRSSTRRGLAHHVAVSGLTGENCALSIYEKIRSACAAAHRRVKSITSFHDQSPLSGGSTGPISKASVEAVIPAQSNVKSAAYTRGN